MSGNHRSGRKRKPTRVLQILGSPQAKGRENEPAVVRRAGGIEQPEILTDAAGAWWGTLYPILWNNGTLSETDATMLAQLCEVLADIDFTRDFVQRNGRFTPVRDRDGAVTGFEVSPAQRLLMALREQARGMAASFGMTPIDRSRVIAVGDPKSGPPIKAIT